MTYENVSVNFIGNSLLIFLNFILITERSFKQVIFGMGRIINIPKNLVRSFLLLLKQELFRDV